MIREWREFPDGPTEPRSGFRVAVTFRDGEVLVGTTENLPSSPAGLILVPADPESNNVRVFVVPSAVRSVRTVPGASPVRREPRGRLPQGSRDARLGDARLPAAIRTWLTDPATT